MGKYYLGTGNNNQINFQVVDSTGVINDLNLSGLYLSATGKAVDADKLDNYDSSYFRDASNLTGVYTGQISGGGVGNADTLDNLDSSYFLNASNITGTLGLNATGLHYISGSLGIGTSSPTHNLEIKNATGSVYQKLNADFGIGYFGMETADDSMRFVTAQATPIQFYTNNTERLRMTSAGNVGIGWVTPYSTLTVGSNDSTAVITPGGNNTHLTLKTVGAAGAIRFYATGGTTSNVAATESMRVDAGGNVGIGTTSPGQLLSLSSAVALGTAINIINTDTGGYNWNIFSAGSAGTIGSAGSLVFRDSTNGVSRMVIKNDGNVGIGTTSPLDKLQVAGSAVVDVNLFVGSGNASRGVFIDSYGSYLYGMNRVATGMDIRAGSVAGNQLFIKTNGNVGIGTITPDYKLEVETGVGDAGGVRVKDSATGVWMDIRRRYVECVGADFWINSQSSSLDLRTGNSSRLFINTSGNVGVGTISPNARLALHHSTGNTIGAYKDGGDATIFLGGGGPTNYAAFESVNNGGLKISTGNGTQTEKVRIDVNGNVGIATTSPGALLDIAQSTAGVAGLRVYNSHATQPYGLLVDNTILTTGETYYIADFRSGGTSRLRINSSGNVGIGTTAPGAKLTIMADDGGGGLVEAIRFNRSGDGLRYNSIYSATPNSAANGTLDFRVHEAVTTASQATVMTLKGSGNVGIGTTSPAAKLHVLATTKGSGINAGPASTGNLVDIYGHASAGGTVHIGTNYYTSDGSLALGTYTAPDTITIQTNGNVGVGTTGPGQKLEVSGVTGVPLTSGTSANGSLRLSSGYDMVLDMGVDHAVSAWIQCRNKTGYGSNYNLALNPNGGNVGIGTTSPAAKLGLTTLSASAQQIIMTNGQDNANDYQEIKFQYSQSNPVVATAIRSIRAVTSNYGAHLAFFTENTAGTFAERMRIDSQGTATFAGAVVASGKFASTVASGAFGVQVESGARIALDGGSNTYIEESSADVIAFVTGGASRLTLSTTTATFAGAVTASSVTTTLGSAISYAAGETYLIWSDESEYSVVDDATDANYKTVKTFVTSKSGTFKFKFSAYIQSGTYYWAWRVLKNGSTVVASGHYNSSLDSGETTSVHAYRRFVGTVSSIDAGDSFALQMVSSTGGGSPVAGNGQLLYAKEFRIYSTTPSVEHGGLSNVWGANVGIGTASPGARLDIVSAGAQPNLRVTSSSWGDINNAMVIFDSGSTGDGKMLRIKNYGARNDMTMFDVVNSVGTVFAIRGDGNVGIGTTNTDPLSLSRDRNLAIVTTGTNAALTLVGGGAGRIDFGVGSTRTAGIYSDATNYTEIFTTTALPLVFSTNSVQRMRITSAGNVGIGTTSPTASGFSTGNPILDLTGTVPTLALHASGSTQQALIVSGGDGLILAASGAATATNNNVIRFYTEETNSQNTPTERVRIDSVGNVGIGTTTPLGNLNVSSATALTTSWISNTAEGTDAKNWAWQMGSGIGSNILRLRASNDAITTGENALVITRSGTTISQVAFPSTTGNVSIASTTASTGVSTGALQVAGGIYAGAMSNLKSLTLGYATADYNTDASLSNYSAANGVYLNGNTGGWLRLSGSGGGTASIQLSGGANGSISMNTAVANSLVLNGTTGAATFAGTATAQRVIVNSVWSAAPAGGGALSSSAAAGVQLTGTGSVNDITLVNSAGSNVLTVPTGTVNATFAGAVSATTLTATQSVLTLGVPGGGGGANINFAYSSNAASRTWNQVSDITAFGDFAIRQSTTQAGSTYANALYFDASRNATFAGAVTAPSLTSPASTNLTLSGGSSGASLVLGQGSSATSLVGTGNVKIGFNAASGVLATFGVSSGSAADGTYLQIRGKDEGSAEGWAQLVLNSSNAAASSGSFQINQFNGVSFNEVLRTTKLRNLLIGTTTDMTGSAGLKVAGTTASTSTTTGSLINAGGFGNAGAIYAGGNIVSNQPSQPLLSVAIAGTSIGSFSAFGADVYIAVDQNANGNMIFRRNSATEAMRITGSNGAVSIASTTASTGVSTGALQVAGGIYAGAASVFGSTVGAREAITVTSTSSLRNFVATGALTEIGYQWANTGTGGKTWTAWSTANSSGLAANGSWILRNETDSITALSFASTGAATFAGAVTIGNTDPTSKLTLGAASGSIEPVINLLAAASGTDKGTSITAYNNSSLGFAGNANNTATSGSVYGYNFARTFSPASGTPSNTLMLLSPTFNWGGTPGAGSYTALKIAAVETAIPTGTNYLINALAGASGTTSMFSVTSTGAATFAGAVTIGGNLTVNGTTTTVNSTTVTVDDPIITLGGDTAPTVDDNKDRGVEFKWHNGTIAKAGFFGFDDSTGYLTFIPDATNTSEVFSGTVGDIQATNFRGNLIGNVTGNVTGNVSGSAGYVATLTAGSYLTGGSFNGSANVTFAVDATSANTVSKVVARDASGNFSAGTITASNVSATTLTQGGTVGHITKEYTFNLSAQSNTQFFPIRLSGSPMAGVIHTVEVLMDSFGGGDPYNHHSVLGKVRGSGWTDLPAFYDVFHNCYDNSERSYLGFFKGTQNCTDVILYVRGGKTYYVKTPSTASVSTTALTVNDSVFAIKDSAATDVSGSSANISFMLNLITSAQGRHISHNLGVAGAATFTGAVSASNLSGTNTGDQTVGNGALTLAVSGTGLSGSASFSANQSGATTFTVASNATSANTASTIVARDGSGNFSAGTISAIAASGYLPVQLALVNNGSGVAGSVRFTSQPDGAGGYITFNGTVTANSSGTAVSGASTITSDHSTRKTGLFQFVGGTSGTAGFQFFTSDAGANQILTERLRIQHDGNVGIGTTSPTNKIQIQTTASNDGLSIFNAGGGANPTLYLSGDSANANGASIAYVNATGNLNITPRSGFSSVFPSGNVGIGTTSPSYKFQVESALAANATFTTNSNMLAMFKNTTSAVSAWGGIKLQADEGSGIWFSDESGTSMHGYISTRYTGQMDFATGQDSATAATVKMSILTSGNVGIGTTSPISKLQIAGTSGNLLTVGTLTNNWGGDVAIGISNANGIIVSKINTSNDTNRVLVFYRDDTNGATISGYTPSGGSGNIGFQIRANASSYFNGGNVGIGTTSPGKLLEVNGNSAGTAQIKVDGGSGAKGYVGTFADSLYLTAGGTYQSGWVGDNAARSIASITLSGATTNSFIAFGTVATDNTAPVDRMRIDKSGNVGIGTITPGYKLEVNGSFAATTKSFVIHHPTKEGKKLRYGSLEGPENGVYIRGKTTSKVIELPDYWTKLVDPDSISVQLTSIGSHQKLYVEKIENNKVYISNENLLAKSINCFFYILAERVDVEKLQVEIDG